MWSCFLAGHRALVAVTLLEAGFPQDVRGQARALLLLARIGQIIEIDRLTVAVDPCGDQAKAIEAGPGRPVAFSERKSNGLLIERQRDLTPSAGGQGGVLQGPVVDGAIRVDGRRLFLHAATLIAFDPISGGKVEALAARPIRGD